ncbi:extracellular solute-binding protein, family 3 [Kordiimonas lacus]|uniref:Extracellular solute-binding protein, family 3 n=2 Tax=Kordiimonas lacus TaxID=637679 RepID=A0A1G6YCG8_9PROT|nr:extracellular solute-binding protein, family 3 [Kordiimonas lacus]
MRPSLLALSVACLLGLVAMPSWAHHPEFKVPHIFATGWGITLDADGSGFYNDYARFTLGTDLSNKNYLVAPYKRAMRGFKRDKSSCVYPKSIDTLMRTGDWEEGESFIESAAMLRSPLRVFTRDDMTIIHSPADLTGKRLAYALGSKIPHSLGDIGVEYIPVADEVDKAKILDTGTVDAMIANMPDAFFVFQSLGQPLPPHDPHYDPIPVPRIRIVCHDTPNNRDFIAQFNHRLQELAASGEMAEHLRELGLDPAEFMP